MIIKILEPALAELVAAAAYYENHEKDLGTEFLAEYEKCLGRLQRLPYAWHPVSKNCRRTLLKRFPYGVIFHVDGAIILILAIMHLHREPDYWHERI